MLKIVIDSNIWISAYLGASMRGKISELVFDDNLSIYYCSELLAEYNAVKLRPRFDKIKSKVDFFADVVPLLFYAEIIKFVSLSRDEKDDYLLSLSLSVNADYLITGDDDLLVLKESGNTKICTITEFINNYKKYS